MKLHDPNILTPVYLKTDKNMSWPKDKMFYILSADGLFLCRNHEWFQSCSPAKHGPGELESQEPFLKVNYPMIPKAMIENALGFFRRIENSKGWESALILVWNRTTNQMEFVCPDQKASGASVKYDIPKLPQHLALIGDIHSHCNFGSNPSWTDEKDETHRPGLHIVIGYINRKEPEFYCVAVADGTRFQIKNMEEVIEGCDATLADPDAAPKEWVEKVKAEYKTWSGSQGGWSGDFDYEGGHPNKLRGPDAEDEKIVDKVVKRIMYETSCPTAYEVRQELFRRTKQCSYLWCEKKGEEVVEEWKKQHESAATK